MPTVTVNGVELFYEVEGRGPSLVVVHGSWTDHTVWQSFADELMRSFRVIGYDRRGYSRSAEAPAPRTRRQDEDDLAGVIEALAGGRAHVVASSFGGLVTLGLAARRPDLLWSMCVHEAPSPPLAGGGEPRRVTKEALAEMRSVSDEIEAGDESGAARHFVEKLALGPGGWEMLPERIQNLFIGNAREFAAEQRDPDWGRLDIEAIAARAHPTLLTKGTVGPRWLQVLQDRLAEALPDAETAVVEGAGHSPHMTHPKEFAELVAAFIGDHAVVA